MMILVAGQAIYDLFEQGAQGSAVTFAARPGGAPFNVAVALARLGQPTGFFGALSQDAMGERLARALTAEGIDAALVKRSARPTALAVVGANALGTPAFSFYGENPAHCDLTMADLPAPLPPGAALYVGCFPLVQEPVGSTLHALAQQQRSSRIIAYDPNVRLSIEPDIQRWRTSFAALSALADVIKIGHEDFAALFGGARPQDKAQEWLNAGAALVLYTEGDEGARLFGRNGQARYRPPPVMVADTVGAGDTAMAAMIAWLAEQNLLDRAKLAALTAGHLKKIVTFACNAAAITCSRIGADPPRRDQVTDR